MTRTHPDTPTHAPAGRDPLAWAGMPGPRFTFAPPVELATGLDVTEHVTPRRRTAADLTPADVGTDVTLATCDWAIAGTLRGVHTETEYVDDRQLADAEPHLVPTSTTTTVTVGPWTATLEHPAGITVEDTRP